MTIEWKFPHNGFGQVRGVSDAGIETFTGTEIQSLAREICQNSLDAAVEGSNATIKVDFEQYRIPSSDIPGYEQYASKIQKAYDYWSKKNSEKTIKVLTKALNAIKKPTTVVLRISDFNTTGLSHPYEDSDEGWNALTKLDGGATKTGDKAGAFGIGKNAPFTNSDYRLVFYRTLNEDQETAAQGMSRFISFPEDLSNSMNTMTTGIGYYGNPEGNLPVDSISELEKLYQRSEIGTDVFVYGFNAGYEWNSDVINEVLENFLMSIHKNLLSVTVDNKNIDNSTLASYLSTYNSKIKNAYWYYQVLVRPETKVFKKDFHGMGRKADGSDAANDNSVERNHGRAIRPYVNLSKPTNGKKDISYEYVPGPFMRMYVKALKNSRTDNIKPFLLIIEEINRANVAAVFGDIFQLLDRGDDFVSEYPIQATEDIKKYLAKELGGNPDDYNKIKIPDNMFIWATMNSADQGVFPMDTAFKRRWDFTYLGIDDNDQDLQGKYVYLADDKSQKVEWNKLRKAINNFLAKEKINEDKQLGPYFISRSIVVPKDSEEIDRGRFINTFKNKVIMYLFEDAAKQKRPRLFEGCFQNSSRYSEICREFEAKGIGIFNHDVQLDCEVEDVKSGEALQE